MNRSNASAAPVRAKRLPDRLQPRHDARRLLVVGRHQQRGARRRMRQRRPGAGAEPAAAACQQRAEAGERAGERQRDPGEQRQEQRQHEDRERGHSVRREHQIHLVQRPRRSARRRRRSPRTGAIPSRAANLASRAACAGAVRSDCVGIGSGAGSGSARNVGAASGCPSVEPGFGQRIVAVHQPGVHLDQLLAALASWKLRRQPPIAGFGSTTGFSIFPLLEPMSSVGGARRDGPSARRRRSRRRTGGLSDPTTGRSACRRPQPASCPAGTDQHQCSR